MTTAYPDGTPFLPPHTDPTLSHMQNNSLCAPDSKHTADDCIQQTYSNCSTVQYSTVNHGRGSQTSALASEPRAHEDAQRHVTYPSLSGQVCIHMSLLLLHGSSLACTPRVTYVSLFHKCTCTRASLFQPLSLAGKWMEQAHMCTHKHTPQKAHLHNRPAVMHIVSHHPPTHPPIHPPTYVPSHGMRLLPARGRLFQAKHQPKPVKQTQFPTRPWQSPTPSHPNSQ
jgi:hypothetical protein